MHVTSNPFFAFHDDVFPAFAKNAVAQDRFHLPSFYYKTIIPDKLFSSLKEFRHISTVEMKPNGTEIFELEINFQKKSRISKEMKIFEWAFFDEKTLLTLGRFKNGSLWVDSDYFKKRVSLRLKASELTEIGFHFKMESSFVDVYEEKLSFRYYSFQLF